MRILSGVRISEEKGNMKKQNQALREAFSQKQVLIASHRGVSGGNILENTIPAFRNALLQGADIVELDVCPSTDGVLYVYHDGYEPFHFGTSTNLRRMTSAQIDALRFTNRYCVKVAQGVERLEDALRSLKGKCFVNLDRCYRDFDAPLQMVRDFGMTDQVIFKTFVEEDLLARVARDYSDVMFMPLLGRASEIETLEKFDLNVVACELVFKDPNQDIALPETVRLLRERYGELWANPICCEDDLILCGGFDDNRSILESFDAGWGELLRRGFRILQTDWPLLLLQYLKQCGFRK